MEIIILDGSKMTTAEEAHSYIASTMRLPKYYGENLDALADCLGELGPDVFVVMINSEDIRTQLGIYGDSLIRVFRDMSGDDSAFTFIMKA